MTFEEYSKTEIFRREQRRLARSKRTGYIGLALCLVGTACLVAAGFLIADEGVTYPPWRLALLIVCTVLGLAAFGAEVFLSVFASDRKDDGVSRRPAFSAALLLYAREYLSDGWQAQNGSVSFDMDFPKVKKGKALSSFFLVREAREEISLVQFGEGVDLMDGYALALFGLFSWLEKTGISVTEISYRVMENGVVARRRNNGKFVLYAGGKWTLSGRSFRASYRRIVKYARRKGLLSE